MFRCMSAAALCALFPFAADAEDITLRADISAATIYVGMAEIERTAPLTLEAGQHDIFIPMRDLNWAQGLQISGPDGTAFGPFQRIQGRALPEGSLDTDAIAAARAAADAAEAAVIAAQDDIAEADAAIDAIEAQIVYLRRLTGGGAEAPMPSDPETLPVLLSVIGQEMARTSSELAATREGKRALAQALTDRQAELAEALATLARLRPYGQTVDGITVTARTDAAVDGTLTVRYLSPTASWMPAYDLHLSSDTGALTIERYITVETDRTAVWTNVAMVFSTSDPNRRRVPRDPVSAPVRIASEVMPGRTMSQDAMSLEAPAPALIEETAPIAVLETNGLSVSYTYTAPVTIGPDGLAVLPFDALEQPMETEARANPRSESTAFLMAMGNNTTGEPILPGPARFYRDGALIGDGQLPLIPTGGEMDLAFGPLDQLQLVWIDRSLAEGDRGVFFTSNTQERRLAFGVENAGDTTERVRLLYATPFAEQEDVDLTVDLSRAPQEREVDDQRGVVAWDLDVAPGGAEMIEMNVAITWPEDQQLLWRP